MTRAVVLTLTVLTGFSGLVYEVAWQKYLATLLGSHSEATASVLAIFLGGLSVGYWLFGRVTRRHLERSEAAGMPPRLLFIYGLLEGGIGIIHRAMPIDRQAEIVRRIKRSYGAVIEEPFRLPRGTWSSAR